MSTLSGGHHSNSLFNSLNGFLSSLKANFLANSLSPRSTKTFLFDSGSINETKSTHLVPSLFYKAIESNKSTHFRFDDATNSSPSSTLAKPFVKSFLATKHFFISNRMQILSILAKLLGLSVSALTTYFLMKWLMKSLDPTNEDKLSAKKRAESIIKQIGISNLDLNEYELLIASNIITPENIDCSWKDIGGLEHLIDDLRETVIYPLRDFETYYNLSSNSLNNFINKRSKLIQPPKGVLLFGPPGNAKTMIAKALAKESGARFINLQVSTLFDKWFGESQKRTEAIFSLASKIQPCIIFIDEIDSFLRKRAGDDHECTATMKTQFMTLWDGLTTQKQNRILIIGATNRPEDVDAAILRRMPKMFHIGLPNAAQRLKILKVILRDEQLCDDVDLDEIAERTSEFSGSDLHELCRNAAMNSFIETVKILNNTKCDREEASQNDELIHQHNCCIRKTDFDVAFDKMAIKNFLTNKNRFDFVNLRH